MGEINYALKCTKKRCFVIAEGWAKIDISINLFKLDLAYYFANKVIDAK